MIPLKLCFKRQFFSVFFCESSLCSTPTLNKSSGYVNVTLLKYHEIISHCKLSLFVSPWDRTTASYMASLLLSVSLTHHLVWTLKRVKFYLATPLFRSFLKTLNKIFKVLLFLFLDSCILPWCHFLPLSPHCSSYHSGFLSAPQAHHELSQLMDFTSLGFYLDLFLLSITWLSLTLIQRS